MQRLKLHDPNWKPTPSLTSTTGTEQVRVTRLLNLAQEAEARIANIQRGGLPYGFRSQGAYREFSNQCRQEFANSGYRDAETYLRGSALTGRKYTTGRPFDGGRKPSDLDLAIISPTMMRRAEELKIPQMARGKRTRALNDRELDRLGLRETTERLSNQQGRPVTIVIYRNYDAIRSRGPHSKLPQEE